MAAGVTSVDHNRRGMERFIDLVMQQLHKIIAAGGGSRLARKIHQDLPRVIRAAEESAIKAPRDPALHLGPYQNEDDAQSGTHGNADSFMVGEVQSQPMREH